MLGKLLPYPFDLFEKLEFWTLTVALLSYVLAHVVPGFPLSSEIMLQIIIGVLALFGIHVSVKLRAVANVMRANGLLPRE